MLHCIFQIKNWLLAALFPSKCPLCFKRGEALHKTCINSYINLEIDYQKQIIWLSRYNEPVIKKLIKNYKFHGFTSVIKPFVETAFKQSLLTSSIGSKIDNDEWTIVPIPLHWTRLLWRGFNQADLIATNIKNVFSNTTISTGLIRIKKTHQQAKLSKTERQKNILKAFIWDNNVSVPKKIIVVDDVYTSGTTINEARDTLLKAGAEEVWCLVLARKI